MPKISVITPVFNGEKYIRAAIDSLLIQDFTDWNLIVIDDGSTDRTPSILESYKDPRISVIHQANKGEASARNLGLENATGEYLAFLDADDVYLPNALWSLNCYLDKHSDIQVVVSDAGLCDEELNLLVLMSNIRRARPEGNLLEKIVLDSSVIGCINCTLTRRSQVEDLHLRFNQELVIGPDWDFWIKLAANVKFGYMDALTCLYRIHKSNVTRSSGIDRRNNDLIRIHQSIISAPWFDSLDINTRQEVFYNLLVRLLNGQNDHQQAVLETVSCLSLPKWSQSNLWRYVGINILEHRDIKKAKHYINEAYTIYPENIKNQILLLGITYQPRLLIALIAFYRLLKQLSIHVSQFNQRKFESVPKELNPDLSKSS